jgi:hypothetical protein
MSDKKTVRLALTDDQKAQVMKATGKTAEAIEFDVKELEERIAPGGVGARKHL